MCHTYTLGHFSVNPKRLRKRDVLLVFVKKSHCHFAESVLSRGRGNLPLLIQGLRKKACKDVETSDAPTAAPADVPGLQPVEDEQVTVDVESIVTEEEADRVLPEGSRRSLREEAVSLFHQLRHKPKNPYCDTCRRAQLRLVRKLTGSFKYDATHWGQHVTGDRMVTLDELGNGLDGGVDAFFITDIYSGLRAAYPAPDKSADSTTIAIRTLS